MPLSSWCGLRSLGRKTGLEVEALRRGGPVGIAGGTPRCAAAPQSCAFSPRMESRGAPKVLVYCARSKPVPVRRHRRISLCDLKFRPLPVSRRENGHAIGGVGGPCADCAILCRGWRPAHIARLLITYPTRSTCRSCTGRRHRRREQRRRVKRESRGTSAVTSAQTAKGEW